MIELTERPIMATMPEKLSYYDFFHRECCAKATFPLFSSILTIQLSSVFPAAIKILLSKEFRLLRTSCSCLKSSALSLRIIFFLFLTIAKSSSRLNIWSTFLFLQFCAAIWNIWVISRVWPDRNKYLIFPPSSDVSTDINDFFTDRVFGENIIKLLHRFVYYFVHSEGDVHLHDEFLVPGEPAGSLPAVLLNGGPQTLKLFSSL